MNKNLKLSFILLMISFGLIISWNSLLAFFGGVGIAFVSLLGLIIALITINLNNKEVFDRTKDLFISLCIFACVEFIVYFVFEFRLGSIYTLEGFCLFQGILALFAILFLAYAVFRFNCEIKNKKIAFIEILLGNDKTGKKVKVKKAKEISNGSLEAKPNSNTNNLDGQIEISAIEETKEVSNDNSEE